MCCKEGGRTLINVKHFCEKLGLEELSNTSCKEMDINVTDINRPGMQFTGFYEYFAHERPQVIGKVEMTYLESLDPDKRMSVLEKYMSYPLPCIIVCWGMTPPRELISLANERGIPVFQSKLQTTQLTFQTTTYLNRELAPHVTRHGVLVDVYGVGVLLTGESGVGKSELALELVRRGHQLCADDVVDICRVADDWLLGESPAMVRHFMEIRGIGIIDIRAMYGVGAVALDKSIDMVIHMENWNANKEYDRLGLQEEYTDILGVKVPYQVMPVRPGRNLAVIVEVAARNHSLKRMGYSAAHELDRRLNALIAQNSGMDE
ncbi:MAG: HPr kinase/phosphorylase [Clostridia bacterium]|nr:HPr kinase/phosphorylase [Clostridia bacterium]